MQSAKQGGPPECTRRNLLNVRPWANATPIWESDAHRAAFLQEIPRPSTREIEEARQRIRDNLGGLEPTDPSPEREMEYLKAKREEIAFLKKKNAELTDFNEELQRQIALWQQRMDILEIMEKNAASPLTKAVAASSPLPLVSLTRDKSTSTEDLPGLSLSPSPPPPCPTVVPPRETSSSPDMHPFPPPSLLTLEEGLEPTADREYHTLGDFLSPEPRTLTAAGTTPFSNVRMLYALTQRLSPSSTNAFRSIGSDDVIKAFHKAMTTIRTVVCALLGPRRPLTRGLRWPLTDADSRRITPTQGRALARGITEASVSHPFLPTHALRSSDALDYERNAVWLISVAVCCRYVPGKLVLDI